MVGFHIGLRSGVQADRTLPGSEGFSLFHENNPPCPFTLAGHNTAYVGVARV